MNATLQARCLSLVVAAAGMSYAYAGCSNYPVKPTSLMPDSQGFVDGLQAAVFSPVSLHTEGSIVGMWRVQFISEGNSDTMGIPDDTVIDNALATWHSDGTEIMNSSRPPITQSFCMGVWKQIGRSTYRLRHIAMSWNVDSTFQGPAEIHEIVTVDNSGNRYTGKFTIDQYLTDESQPPVAHLTGDLKASRVTVN